jgi:type II secretory pathway pseudopilin PulG
MNKKILKTGFHTVELIVVSLVVVVMMAIAIPNFLRAKLVNNESAALVNLYKLAGAFEAYRTMFGTYPTTFTQLRNTQPPLMDLAWATSGQKQGYTFRVSTESDVVPTYAFRIFADPTQFGVTGNRYFKIGSSEQEANGSAYYATIAGGPAGGPWTAVGVEGGGGSGTTPDCTGIPCSICNGAGCTSGGQDCTGIPCSICNGTGCTGGSGGSCPYIHTWDGKQFVKDNDIIPGGKSGEYTDYYKLTKAPKMDKQGELLFKIIEPLDEKSHLDRLSLLEVIHPQSVKIAPTPEGKIVTFENKNLTKALTAADKKGKDVLKLVASKDNGNYHGVTGDFITFDFGLVKNTQKDLRLILSSDLEDAFAAQAGPCVGQPCSECPGEGCIPDDCIGKPCSSCYGAGCVPVCQAEECLEFKSIHIELLVSGKEWKEIAVIHPHENWDIWAVDLAAFKDKVKGNLKIKVTWRDEHKLDFVLLDESKQVPIKVKELALLEAKHNRAGDVLNLLKLSDNRYAAMNKGDEISLKFASPSKQSLMRREAIDYIFVSEGWYKQLKK